MSSQISINNSFFASAPTSPNRSLSQNISPNNNSQMCFYSVPASPARGMLVDAAATSHLGSVTTTETTTPNTYDGDDANSEDFEFETSRHFHNVDVVTDGDDYSDLEISHNECAHEEAKKYYWRQRHESLPAAMAFADELFCDGKVMPLNPPPCQQYYSNNTSTTTSPSLSPRTATSTGTLFGLGIPHPMRRRRSLWNDDFDPFMVALENVKEDKKRAHHRRAWSMLPLRACTQWEPDDLMGCDHCLHSSPHNLRPNKQMGADGSAFPTWIQHQQTIKDGLKSPIRLAEPKGVVFARRARMVKMGYNGPIKPITVPVSEPMVESEENARLGSKNCTSENKWNKMMSFAVRGLTMKRTSDEHKEKDQNVEFSRPKIMKKLSFRSKKSVQTNVEKQQVPQMTKMSIVRYKPKLLLCMGYGAAKYDKTSIAPLHLELQG